MHIKVGLISRLCTFTKIFNPTNYKFASYLSTKLLIIDIMKIVTLDEFIIRRQNDFGYATGELTALLRDIGVAAKIVNREVK